MSEREDARAFVRAFDDSWREYQNPYSDGPVPRDRDWSTSVRHWRERGLELETLLTFVDQVMEDERFAPWRLDGWKYLCGMCHRHLKERDL